MNGFHVIIREIPANRGGGFEAEILEIPGLVVYGATIEEVKHKILKRVESWLGLTRRLGWMVKIDYSLERQGDVVRPLAV